MSNPSALFSYNYLLTQWFYLLPESHQKIIQENPSLKQSLLSLRHGDVVDLDFTLKILNALNSKNETSIIKIYDTAEEALANPIVFNFNVIDILFAQIPLLLHKISNDNSQSNPLVLDKINKNNFLHAVYKKFYSIANYRNGKILSEALFKNIAFKFTSRDVYSILYDGLIHDIPSDFVTRMKVNERPILLELVV